MIHSENGVINISGSAPELLRDVAIILGASRKIIGNNIGEEGAFYWSAATIKMSEYPPERILEVINEWAEKKEPSFSELLKMLERYDS